MDFSNYKPVQYYSTQFQDYIYSQAKHINTPPQVSDSGFSIEDILEQDSGKLLDKVVSTALSLSYRLRLYRESGYALQNIWNETSEQIGGLSSFMLGYNMNIERRKSMLEKERNGLEMRMLENKHETWKDLNEPISYFIEQWHKRQELKQDKKILG